jgi:hypothetical protein
VRQDDTIEPNPDLRQIRTNAVQWKDFDEHKQNIVTKLNELGKAITDVGLIAALHLPMRA